jgi:hypothetical protein
MQTHTRVIKNATSKRYDIQLRRRNFDDFSI